MNPRLSSAQPSPARYRWLVFSRVVAAVVAGYTLASSATVLLALLWPLPQAEAVLAASMLSFLLYAGVIVWSFSVKRLRTVWLGLMLANGLCLGLSWCLLPGASL